MKVSLNWLREYVELPDDVAGLCDLLTLAGVEVEAIGTRGVTTAGVVVAQILSSERHPNADRLRVCAVEDGSGAPRQIVCGATNYKVGDKVPLALPGAVLPGDFTIKVGKLRGVESQGMLCSAKELNLAEDGEGLMILPPASIAGEPLQKLFPPDTILDVEITPNRPDLLSHIGMAREIAALSGRDLHVEPVEPFAAEQPRGVEIKLEAGDDCPFYTARKISGVKIGPSPHWLKRRIEGVGVRSINNVVDITNFVMLEMGEPLHAFDAALIQGGIRVRHAANGEEFLALDGRTYALKPSHMVIADFERSIAIAGVMGGERSGVTETTRDVILESAYFRPGSIRRASRELGLASDSSYRFERGVDAAGVNAASLRAAHLIAELAGGMVESCVAAGDEPGAAKTASEGLNKGYVHLVPLRHGRCSEVAGGEVPEIKVGEILTRLGLMKKGDAWQVPGYRPDLTREIDLVEEVIRVFGIENIPARMQGYYAASTVPDAIHDRCVRLRRDLAGIGFYEARNVAMISERAAKDDPLAVEDLRSIKNPLSEDQTILRPNLLPGMLQALARNLRAGGKDVRLFEIGRVFRATGREERLHLALVMTGTSRPASWRGGDPEAADFFDLKGVIESLGFEGLAFAPAESQTLPLAAEVRAGDEVIGYAGQLAPARAREIDATAPVLVAEIELSLLSLANGAGRAFREIARFPAITRDIALLTPLATQHAEIERALLSAKEPLLERVILFDVFTDPSGEKIPVDRKSLAYSLTYRTNERTLTTDEVSAAHARLKERLKATVDVQLRE